MLSKQDLFEGFKKTGIKKGDIAMVHSSYASLRGTEGGPEGVIDTLLELLGPEGTLIIPAFNFNSWSNEHYFDIVETPSEMGVITEIARARKESKRTEHPIYSFIILGNKQNEFLKCNDKEAFGQNSVFAMFHKLNGLIISIGLEFNSSFTLIHYAEINSEIEYRRIKDFSGIYVGYDRVPILKTYSMLVRSNLKYKTMVNPGLEILEQKGVIKNIKIGSAKVDYSRAEEFYSAACPIIKSNPELFHLKK